MAVDLAPGFAISRTLSDRVSDDEVGYDCEVIADLDDGRFVCHEPRILRKHTGPPVSNEKVRSIPVALP